MFARERRDRLHSLLELHNAYRGTALVLGDVVEADDGYTGEHCKQIVGLALAAGEQLGLLHDVGKIAIPKPILNRPGKLDSHEWTVMKSHTIEGQRMLARVGGFMREVGSIVRAHHERWDGGGCPDGIAGEAIPLEARIIACCDSWNAMRTDRVYRKALPYAAAMFELQTNAGSQFDPRVVDAFVRVVEPAEQLASAEGAAARTAPVTEPAEELVVVAEPSGFRARSHYAQDPLVRPATS